MGRDRLGHLPARRSTAALSRRRRIQRLPHPGAEGELAALAARTGLTITISHLPPGTSKWNKIEHRQFSHISMNWRGRPLASHETISAATTRTCLRVRADLDTAEYPTRVEIPDRDMATLTDTGTPTRHDFDGEWNYTPPPEPRHARTRLNLS